MVRWSASLPEKAKSIPGSGNLLELKLIALASWWYRWWCTIVRWKGDICFT